MSGKMGRINFTQYLRPHGYKQRIYIDMPDEVCRKAEAINKAGCVFECEVLSTGHVSFTIVGLDESDEMNDLAIRIVENGPKVPEAVERLVMDFDIDKSKAGG